MQLWVPTLQHPDLRASFTKSVDNVTETVCTGPHWHCKTVFEKYACVMDQIRSILYPLARLSQERLTKPRNAYKLGWSPEFMVLKIKLTFLLKVKAVLLTPVSLEAQTVRILFYATQWQREVTQVLKDESRATTLLAADDYSPTYYRTASIAQIRATIDAVIAATKCDMHGRKRATHRQLLGETPPDTTGRPPHTGSTPSSPPSIFFPGSQKPSACPSPAFSGHQFSVNCLASCYYYSSFSSSSW